MASERQRIRDAHKRSDVPPATGTCPPPLVETDLPPCGPLDAPEPEPEPVKKKAKRKLFKRRD